MRVNNPVLCGFNPDPSMIYVDGFFYIAVSTFEWFPGISIYESKDLCSFRLVSRPLNTEKLLAMRGIPFSGGVWAPCLSYNEVSKKFFLVYSNQHSWADDPFKDCNNYVISASHPAGEWSEPVYINSSGFDASLFHDDDGKSYYMNMEWNHLKKDKEQFSGILLAEFDTKTGSLKEPMKKVFKGSELGRVEGPHVYKKDGYYYMFTAEGGTGYEHAVTVARSRNVYGPYELHPNQQILSSFKTANRLQKSGHASICCDKVGNWYLAHLCSRPLSNGRCVLGRETAIQNLVWKDNWPYLANGTTEPSQYFETHCENISKEEEIKNYTFNDKSFLADFQTLRLPYTSERFNLKDGSLILTGKDSPLSLIEQTVICRRQTDFCFQATAQMEFEPESFQHMAGLLYRYNEKNQYYLYSSFDEKSGCVVLSVMSFNNGLCKIMDEKDCVKAGTEVFMRVSVQHEMGQFWFSQDGHAFTKIGDEFDASILSDDYAAPMGFTGAFVGMACQDLQEHKKCAEFKSFTYEKINKF